MADFMYRVIIIIFVFQAWHALALNFGKERMVNVVNRIAAEVVLVNEGDCIDSLSKFRVALEGESASTIVLCPYSVFNMHGSEPLPLKSDTAVVCGADGSVSNKCVVKGGATQFVSDHEVANVTVKGVTLVGAYETAIVLNHSGSITFENRAFQNSRYCVFRIDYKPGLNNTTFFDGVIQEVVNNVKEFLDSVKNWSPMDGLRRHLKVSDNVTSGRSSVGQTIPAVPRLAVRLVGCVFQGNSVAARASAGMITVDSSGTDLLIWDTMFLDNDYGSTLENGYAAMISDGSSVNLRNNCFINNIFRGIGVIIIHTGDVFLPVNSQAINNAGIESGQTACEFIGLVSSNAFESELYDNLSCVDYDGFTGECAVGSL